MRQRARNPREEVCLTAPLSEVCILSFMTRRGEMKSEILCSRALVCRRSSKRAVKKTLSEKNFPQAAGVVQEEVQY